MNNKTPLKIKGFFGIGLVCIFYWVADSIWSYISFENNLRNLIFKQPNSYLDTFLLQVNPYQTFSRIFVVSLFILLGIVIVRFMDKQQRTEKQLRRTEEQFRGMADTSPLAIYMSTGMEQKGEYINSTFKKFFGYSLEEIPTIEHWWPIAYPDESYRQQISEEWQKKVELAIGSKSDIEPMEVEVTCKDGSKKIISWGYIVIGEKNWAFGQDLTKRKQVEEQIKASLKEKETLLQEIHHRVKNNMQVINSLLKLQSNTIDDEKVKNILKDSQSRVYAMSAVHETLHGSENLSAIDLKSYLSKITSSIFQTYSTDHGKVNLNSDIENSPISLNQAYPLGLVNNELISNALKYAFPEDRTGEISVSMKKIDNELELVVMDDGIGIPDGLDWKNSRSLGLKLVHTLVENQLGGSIEMKNNNGTKFTIKFKIEA